MLKKKMTKKAVDKLQRKETNRKRGWHDYKVLVRGDMNVFNSLCSIQTKGTYDGWGKFSVSGTENVVVNFVVVPPASGRFPNYRATDHAAQVSDAAIIVVKPSIYTSEYHIGREFEAVKNSYEGKNAVLYGGIWDDYYTPIPTEKELVTIKERSNRPIALVLLTSKDDFQKRFSIERSPCYEIALSAKRDDCAKFMRDIGVANNVRFLEIEDANKNRSELNNVVSLLLSDIQEGRGVSFSPPSSRPWDLSHTKKFDTLDILKDLEHIEKKLEANRPSLWTRLVNFVTGKQQIY